MRSQDTAGVKTPEQFRQFVVELLTTGDEAISESVAQECASQIIETLAASCAWIQQRKKGNIK